MSNNLLLAAVIGAAVFIVVKKQGQAAVLAKPGYIAPGQVTAGMQQSANMNSDMWTRLLGSSWKALADNSPAVIKNVFGQSATGDGKPLSGGDPMALYMQLQAGDVTPMPVGLGGMTLPASGDYSGPADTVMSWDDLSEMA